MNLPRRAFSTLLATLLIAQPAFAQAPASILTKIGAAAAVKGRVNAVAPNTTVGRVIESGKTLYLNDHVTTDAAGHLQVLLLDESVFTLGPSSDMKLDEFVYDPNTQTGKVAANFVKGTFRFVTGKVARKDPDQVKIKLAVGTIGIRGSVGVVQTDQNGSTVINAGAGGNNDAGESSAGIFVSNEGASTDLSRPGFGTTIGRGQPPAPATNMTAQLNGIMLGLGGGSGGAGGGGSASNGGTGGNGGNVGDTSGKNTATGGVYANDTSDTQQLQSSNNTTTTNASQQAGPADGTSNWQDLLALNQGTAWYFSGHSPISCSGAGCINLSSPNNPQGAVQLYVDFNAQTLGGGGAFTGPSGINGSFIHMHNITASGDTLQMLIGAGGSGLNPMTYAGLTGPATLTLTGSNTGSYTTSGAANSPTGNFNGTVLTFQNAGGVAAATLQVQLKFTGSNSFSQSINASGTFQAPKQ